MTESAPRFILRVVRVVEGLHHNPGRMLLIVRWPYAHLEERLRRLFEGRHDVEVILDRRRGERRTRSQDQPERRRTDRRIVKEDMLEIILEGDGD
jgi:hypothetical protein